MGKEVIVHTDPINVPGWKGAGYIITDPETGAGAWKIGGGGNGGEIDWPLPSVFIESLLSLVVPAAHADDTKWAGRSNAVGDLIESTERCDSLADALSVWSGSLLLSAFIGYVMQQFFLAAGVLMTPLAWLVIFLVVTVAVAIVVEQLYARRGCGG